MSVFAITEAQQLIQSGATEFRHDRSTQITPAARDLLGEAGIKVIFTSGGATSSAPVAAPSGPPAKETDTPVVGTKPTPGEIEKLFHCAEAQRVKAEMCDIGRRIWDREYCDGNGGNITYRIGVNQILCTPTMVSKGFLKPEMMCMVDLEGNQLAGDRKRTSEALTHLAIYKGSKEAKAVTHAHPVHATAFAMAGYEPPECLIPEAEVFIGRVPLAPYRTPGSPEMNEVIQPLAEKHQAILMGNHGVLTWGNGVEDAYWRMEILEAYCKTLVVASHLPSRDTTISGPEVAKLLDLKKSMGIPDAREGLTPVQLCEIDPWESLRGGKSACSCTSQQEGKGAGGVEATNAELEAMVQRITDEVMQGFNK
jgi:L-fuculose-phosphate aldolase